jgi:hypothetical protein
MVDDIALPSCGAAVSTGSRCDGSDSLCTDKQGQTLDCVDGVWQCAQNACVDLGVRIYDMKELD